MSMRIHNFMGNLKWIKSHLNLLTSMTLSLVVIYVAMQHGGELFKALKQVRVSWAVAGLGCYGINYLLRALRIKIVMKDRIRMWPDAVHTACLHGLATYLLPFRFGDFILPVILNKISNLNFANGASVLISVRLLDLWALGFWVVIASVLIDFSLPASVHVLWVLFGISLSILPLILKSVIKLGERLTGKFWRQVIQWGTNASYSIEGGLVSFGIWTCVGACFFCTAKAIGLPLDFMDVWLLITIQLPLQMIPLQGVANAGNHEGGWIAGLSLLGIPADQGLQFALLSHALLLSYVLTLGPLAFFIRTSAENKLPRNILSMPNPSVHIEQTNYISQNPIVKVLLSNFIDKICETLVFIDASKKKGIDAGCGEAHMLGHLHARGVLGEIVAVDVNDGYLVYAMKKHPNDHFLAADLGHLPFPDHTFDYVISTEVFEHLDDPFRAISELRRIGKKDAYLIISVPFEPFFHVGNIARGKYWGRGGYTPDHRNLWRRNDFRRFLAPFVHIEREYGFKSFPWLLFVCRFKSCRQ